MKHRFTLGTIVHVLDTDTYGIIKDTRNNSRYIVKVKGNDSIYYEDELEEI